MFNYNKFDDKQSQNDLDCSQNQISIYQSNLSMIIKQTCSVLIILLGVMIIIIPGFFIGPFVMDKPWSENNTWNNFANWCVGLIFTIIGIIITILSIIILCIILYGCLYCMKHLYSLLCCCYFITLDIRNYFYPTEYRSNNPIFEESV